LEELVKAHIGYPDVVEGSGLSRANKLTIQTGWIVLRPEAALGMVMGAQAGRRPM
jgi:hypothetical protein